MKKLLAILVLGLLIGAALGLSPTMAVALLIYFVCFFGVIYFFKQKNYQLLLLFLLSILYYIITFGWTGMTRLFVPNLIYLSFFFGNGVVKLLNQSKKIT